MADGNASADQYIDAVTSVGAVATPALGAAAQNFASFAQVVSASRAVQAHATMRLAMVTQSATGARAHVAAAVQRLDDVRMAVVTQFGRLARSFPRLKLKGEPNTFTIWMSDDPVNGRAASRKVLERQAAINRGENVG